MAISEFLAGVQAVQDNLAAANRQIAALEEQRREIAARPPHTDDIANALRRGLDAAQASFAKRLSFYLNDNNASRPHAAEMVANSSAQLLNVPAMLPSANWSTLFHNEELGSGAPALDTAAVTFFLRDRIERAIPYLVEECCPGSKNGLRQEDRQKQLADIDTQVSVLRTERDRIREELDAARQAITPVNEVDSSQVELDGVVRLLRERQLERSAIQAELANARADDRKSARTQNLIRDYERLTEEVTRLHDKHKIIAAEIEAQRRIDR